MLQHRPGPQAEHVEIGAWMQRHTFPDAATASKSRQHYPAKLSRTPDKVVAPRFGQ
jgi:hypothetical protein